MRDDDDRLAEQFEEHRRHLHTVAHRMLGSAAEADDVLQEAWLRLSRADVGAVAPGKRADLIRVHVARDIPVVRSVWREGRRVA